MDTSSTALFMSVVIVGGILLQWPLGWLSDVFDRRRVITGAFAGVLVVSACIVFSGTVGLPLFVFGAAFGGLSFALYPLCVAHTNDRLASEERVQASGGLVLAYSAGAVMGPVVSSSAMTIVGAAGLFAFIALCAGGALAFALWRERASAPVPGELQQPYRVLPRTTPMSATLDPMPGDNRPG
jgi:MFS family permease